MNVKSIKLIQTTSEAFGAAIGGAIGLLGGPSGAIGGSVAGVLISKALTEVADRYLSKREQARIGASAGYAIIGVKQKLESGIRLREDNFFDAGQINRSKAEELFEGILLKCKNEFEEKKIRHISKIFENVAFDNTVDPVNANQVLNLAQQLSYRQLTIVSLIGQNLNNQFRLRATDYRRDNEEVSFDTELEFILRDFATLEKQGLIVRSDYTTILDCSDVAPGGMRLTGIGNLFCKLLNLSDISLNEIGYIERLR